MKRPLAVLAATALATIVGLTPALAANAASVPSLPNHASWVNGMLRVVWSTPSTGLNDWPASDVFVGVTVDGVNVDEQDDVEVRNRVVEVPRASDAGPAKVEVIFDACVDATEGYDCTPHTLYSATVSQQIVKPKKGQVSAVTLLGELKVAKESHAASYRSSKFKRWVDANRDGEDTRAEVLKAESKKKVTKGRDHQVKSGRWVSAYDGKVLRTASKLEIDHLVPLKEAWTSGASAWSTKKRTAFANDTGYAASLIAVSKQAERAKGSKEPNAYLPGKASARCAYVRDYIAVKHRWGLKVDATEKSALRADLATYCVSPYVAKPGKPNLTALVAKPKPKHHSGSGSTHGVDPRYATCTELHRHPNHAPYRRGVDPEYPWYQDRDHDGLVCE